MADKGPDTKLDSLHPGMLLIAMPAMDDPRFARSVVLLCQHGEEGAMGLVINRAADYSFDDIFRQMQIDAPDPALCLRSVQTGGPVQGDRGFVLHDGERDYDSTLRIGPDLAISTSRDILQAIAGGIGPRRFELLLGYAGWGPEQLESELAENAWLTVAGDPELLFDVPLEQRWQVANARIGFDPSQLAGYAGHA